LADIGTALVRRIRLRRRWFGHCTGPRMTMKTSARIIQVFLISIGALAIATRAQAQDDLIDSAVAHVGVGAGINFYRPSSNDADSSQGIVVMYRWHSFHSGWGPTFGLDWHSTVFHQPVGDVADVPMGSLRMRALLAGFGYRRPIHRFTAAANVSAGYSFNHLTDDSGMGAAFARTGVSLIDVHVNDSAIVKPEVAVWYDLFKHVGIGVSAAYLFNRPDEVIRTTAGSRTRELNANTFALAAGLTFGVWKKSEQ
jgi:hypothetical protein